MPFDSQLSPLEEMLFRAWAGKRVEDTEDYDLRGYYSGGGSATPVGEGHLTDRYKKPNHPTFSTESMYSTPDELGGTWGPGYKSFMPSQGMLDKRSLSQILEYFRQHENNVEVDNPYKVGR